MRQNHANQFRLAMRSTAPAAQAAV